MAVFLSDCPHCGARHTTFTVHSSRRQVKEACQFNVFSSCPACDGPVSAVIHNGGRGHDPGQSHENLSDSKNFRVQAIFPRRQGTRIPEHAPEAASKAFLQGAESLKDSRYTAAVAMFRRTIDVATKEFTDAVEAWNLEKRIDKLANAGLITKDLQAWAHKIRLEGNQAIHELDEPTKEQATELELFTELMLTYMFTLPAKVRANIPAEE